MKRHALLLSSCSSAWSYLDELTLMKLLCCVARTVSEKALLPSSLLQVEDFHPLMPARHLAARASNSEDSRRSQSVAAADHPGPDLDEEAGGPGCCGRAVPCHCLCRPPPHALYAKRTQRTVCVVLLEDCSRCLCLQTADGGLRLACRGTMRVPGCLPSWKERLMPG